MPLYRHLSFTLDNRVCGHNRPPWVCRCNFSFDAVKGFFTPPRLYFFAGRSEYNRGSSYHRAFYAPMSFCSFLPLSNLPKNKNRAMPLCCHIRHYPAAQSDTRSPDTSIPIRRVCVLLKIIWVILLVQRYNTNIAPASTTRKLGYTNSRPCRGQPYAFVCPLKS